MTPNILLVDEKNHEKVTACLVSLASNYQADRHLKALSQQFYQDLPVKSIEFSDIILSPDTKQTADCLVYHNQMALIHFYSPLPYFELHQLSKNFETLASRHQFAKPIVTLDVDIIAIEVQNDRGNSWKGFARRLPLASYECQGVQNLLDKIGTADQHQHFLQSLLPITIT